MTKFKKFSEFICVGYIYPLVLTLVSIIAAVAIYFYAGLELFWLINAAVVLSVVCAVWGVVFLVVITINKVIEWREERQWRKEHPNEEAYD